MNTPVLFDQGPPPRLQFEGVCSMSKILVGATALILVATSLAVAQPAPGASKEGDGRRWQFSQDDARAMIDARVAALKAGLKLTPDQEKNWPAFEQSYRELAQQRMQWRIEQRNQPRSDNAIERLQRRADRLATLSAALKKFAAAAAPLYQSLDEGQKRRFALLSRPVGMRHHPHFAFWRREGGQGRGR